MSGKVLVFGSINTDLVVYVEALPQPGETVSGGAWDSFPGGKGANQAVAAARSGVPVSVYGCLGDDSFGHERLAALAATGIATDGVRLKSGARSGVAMIMVDAHGENSIAVAPGANMLFVPGDVTFPEPRSGETWVALFQNEIPRETTESLIVTAHARGCFVIWNIAPTIGKRPDRAILESVDCLMCNRNELAALVGGDAPIEEQARAPLAWGAGSVIVTLGSKGSMWVSKEETFFQEAFPVESIDAVGAGDCFCGVFAASLAKDGGITGGVRKALRRASAAAAISTTRKGAQPSMPDSREVDEFLRARAR